MRDEMKSRKRNIKKGMRKKMERGREGVEEEDEKKSAPGRRLKTR